ncbi:TetR/AcrR family transcriptional regulator [Martelella soudanensis]|uniref:TetR/AcrR family transcriptional regulator n=1 Tax=unclassified Martelella TaxID=2629616 RepID=UPI0015DEE578|nr:MULTISPECIES: TetR/AcrR family transcriptional regulator [unclassified Martelella]
MSKRDIGKREKLVEAAVNLAYRQGYTRTTIADIARESGVPLGNVYYYFKTRDDIATAILDHRKGQFESLKTELAGLPSPKARLVAFVNATVGNAGEIALKGCPTGSLSAELLKAGDKAAVEAFPLLAAPMAWMAEQFAEMGHGEDAEALALQLQSSLQGASLLAQNARNPELLAREGARLKMWINGL